MKNWIQIGNDQNNKIKEHTESERNYIIQSSVSVWITAQGEVQTDSDEIRMNQIINYVNENYQNHMSLSELAEELFVATSTLSRLFQKQTGMKFAEFLNHVRIHFAAKELITSSKTVTKIAVDNGFSNAPAMNRVFRQYYQCTPLEYRERKKEELEKVQREVDGKRVDELISETRNNKNKSSDTQDDPTVLEANVRRKSKLVKNWNRAVNIGSTYNLTLANLQYHTIYLTETLGFPYIRI